MSSINQITEADFDERILSDGQPKLVDFFASWCMPCRVMAQTLDDVIGEYSSEIDFFKADIDRCPNIASSYGISSVPTLLIFKDGDVIARSVGAMSKRSLGEFIDNNI